MKKLSALLMLLMLLPLRAQQEMALPMDYAPVVFAGNFGEIRTNHFHGGLDFKTGGVEGRPVKALSDGYIAALRVNSGSGNVLYVTYQNGYSAVYRHLSRFMPALASLVEARQYEQEQWEQHLTFSPTEHPVSRGQVIGWSGNTGYSFGPHLHLDIYETESDDFVDPLPFFLNHVKDDIAPQAEGFMLLPQRGMGTVNGKSRCQRFPLQPKEPITAWGVIGAALKAHDHMNEVHNAYGVKTVVLRVDGKEVFRSDVDRFSSDEHRYINSWTQQGYMKSYVEPGNRLRMLKALNEDRGLVTISEERPYVFEYTLSDAFGNTSTFSFTVQGRQTDIPEADLRAKHVLAWNKTNYIQEPGMELVVPNGVLYDDAWLNSSVTVDSGSVSYTYRLNDTPIPLHRAATLTVSVRSEPEVDTSKYYMAQVLADGKLTGAGGHYANGKVTAKILTLGTYRVCIDTIAPEIIPVSPNLWAKNGKIVFKARDNATGISRYRGTIDGQYALFGKLNSVNNQIVCVLDPKRVKRGCKHTLTFTVEDGCGNVAEEHYTFTW